jgi:hypothetical protein
VSYEKPLQIKYEYRGGAKVCAVHYKKYIIEKQGYKKLRRGRAQD